MKRLACSEWLVVKPALDSLADYLRSEIETVKAVEALFQSSREEAGRDDTEVVNAGSSPVTCAALAFRPFYEADGILREHGLDTQADDILRLYGDSCENAPRTLQYVESVAQDLAPSDAKGSESDTTINKREANRKPRGQTVNSRMLEIMQKDSNRVKGWTCKQWAEELSCSRSAVCETETWKMLQMPRLELRAGSALDRRRNGKPLRHD